MSSKPDSDPTDSPSSAPPGPLHIILSVLSAFFGVQSEKNRARDFQQGRPIHYILIGLIVTLLLILGIWVTVTLVLNAAGI